MSDSHDCSLAGPDTTGTHEFRALHVLAPSEALARVHTPGVEYIDPRGPDGVTIIAPYEQSRTNEHPGVQTGVAPTSMQLFDLLNDPSEQVDVASQNPEIVGNLKVFYDEMVRDFPSSGVTK